MKKFTYRLVMALLVFAILPLYTYADDFNIDDLDKNKYEIIELKGDFDAVYSGRGEYITGRNKNKKRNTNDYSVFDSKGNLILDKVGYNSYSLECLGYYKKYGKRQGYVDKDDNLLFNSTFNKIELSKYGYALVQVEEDSNVYLLDLEGNILREYPPMEQFRFTSNPDYFIETVHVKLSENSGTQYSRVRRLDDGELAFENQGVLYVSDISEDGLIYGRVDDFSNKGFLDLEGKEIFTKTKNAGITVESSFIENSAIVSIKSEKGEKFGLINKKEEIILPIEYDKIRNIGSGRYVVKKDGNHYVVANNGKVISSYGNIGYVFSFDNGMYAVKNAKKIYFYDESFNLISDKDRIEKTLNSKGFIAVSLGDKHYFIKKKDFSPIKESIPKTSIKASEGLAGKNISSILLDYGRISASENRIGDVANFVGENLEFDGIYSDKGIFKFRDKNTNDVVLIDKKGKMIGNTKYREIGEPREKSILSYDNKLRIEKTDVLDEFGKSIFKDKFTILRHYKKDDVYVVQKKIGKKYKFGVADKNGKIIIKPTYNDILFVYKGMVSARIKDKIGVVDLKGNTIIDFKYENINLSNEDAIIVTYNDETYLVDKNDKQISNKKYDYIKRFNKDGYAIAKRDDKYFVIDNKAKEVYQMTDKYNYLLEIDDANIVRARMGNDITYIKLPNISKNSKFDLMYTTEYRGIYQVEKNYMYGLCDEEQNIIVPVKYDNIYPIHIHGELIAFGLEIENGKKETTDLYLTKSKKYFAMANDVLEPYSPPYYMDFDNNFALIERKSNDDEIYGLTDGKKTIIEPKYKRIVIGDEFIYAFDKKIFEQKKTDKIYKYSLDGKLLGELENNRALQYEDGIGYIDMTQSKKSRYVDMDGNCILEDVFEQFSPFVNGSCVIRIYKDNKYKYGIVELSKLKELGGIK